MAVIKFKAGDYVEGPVILEFFAGRLTGISVRRKKFILRNDPECLNAINTIKKVNKAFKKL